MAVPRYKTVMSAVALGDSSRMARAMRGSDIPSEPLPTKTPRRLAGAWKDVDIVDTASGEAAVVMRKHDAAAARTMALAIVRSTCIIKMSKLSNCYVCRSDIT